MYLYLNKKHKKLVPIIDGYLREMKKDGTYARIKNETLAPFYPEPRTLIAEIRQSPFKGRIARRLIFYVLLFSSLITFFGTSLQLYLDYTHDISDIKENMAEVKSGYLRSIINSLWVSDMEQLEIELRGILALPDMQAIKIVKDNSDIISLGSPVGGNIISEQFPLKYSFNGRELDLGTLDVTANLDNVYHRLFGKVFLILVTQAIKTFLVAFFIFFLFFHLVGRHLGAMADYARGFSLSRLDRPLVLDRKTRHRDAPDELDIVATSINEMRRNLIHDMDERTKAQQEKERLEERLRQSQKMEAIGTLAGGIAHDFNNILSVIMGFAELIKVDLPAESPFNDGMDKILQASNRARELVKQILAFSRQDEPQGVCFRPAQIINEGLKLLRSTIPATIHIHEDIDPHCSMILGDPTQLHQILVNLCTNAFHAMEQDGGELDVSLRNIAVDAHDFPQEADFAGGEYVELGCGDTGQGADPDVLARVFEPYFTTKEFGKGSGMGLAIVHGIVKSWKGLIDIRSAPGKGTEVRVLLPARTSTAEDRQTKARRRQSAAQANTYFLSMTKRSWPTWVARMLEQLGFKVTTVTSSAAALEIFRKRAGRL